MRGAGGAADVDGARWVWSSIVNASSAAVKPERPVNTWTTLRRAAIDTFTLGLAKEVAGEGIRVNAVRPGIIDTEIHRAAATPSAHAWPDQAFRCDAPAALSKWLRADPLARCRTRASYCTGTILDVAGGR